MNFRLGGIIVLSTILFAPFLNAHARDSALRKSIDKRFGKRGWNYSKSPGCTIWEKKLEPSTSSLQSFGRDLAIIESGKEVTLLVGDTNHYVHTLNFPKEIRWATFVPQESIEPIRKSLIDNTPKDLYPKISMGVLVCYEAAYPSSIDTGLKLLLFEPKGPQLYDVVTLTHNF